MKVIDLHISPDHSQARADIRVNNVSRLTVVTLKDEQAYRDFMSRVQKVIDDEGFTVNFVAEDAA